MSATIFAITTHPPNFSNAAWLGGAGLSVCGLFIIQYISVKAFSITNEDIGDMLKDNNCYINAAMLATAVASPIIIAQKYLCKLVGCVLDGLGVFANFLKDRSTCCKTQGTITVMMSHPAGPALKERKFPYHLLSTILNHPKTLLHTITICHM